jgi:hypothetical protein
MRVVIELPDGWGPGRVVMVRLQQLGYHVTEMIDMGTGRHWLEVT